MHLWLSHLLIVSSVEFSEARLLRYRNTFLYIGLYQTNIESSVLCACWLPLMAWCQSLFFTQVSLDGQSLLSIYGLFIVSPSLNILGTTHQWTIGVPKIITIFLFRIYTVTNNLNIFTPQMKIYKLSLYKIARKITRWILKTYYLFCKARI